MREYKLNKNTQFIEQYFLKDLSICDKLIKVFENSKDKTLGKSGYGYNKKLKDSTDLSLFTEQAYNSIPEIKLYFDELGLMIYEYKKKYKYCDKNIAEWRIENNFNIQKYKPTQGYHIWHSERGNVNSSNRHLVYMTYLNDVKKGGETEWYYQNLKIKPKKGLTVIWSADWTFTHKGHTTIDENKYIITGWYELKRWTKSY